MAKPFGFSKRPQFYLKNQSIKELINLIIEVYKNIFVNFQVVITEKGGYGGGGTT